MSANISSFPGTPLRAEDFASGRVLTVAGAEREAGRQHRHQPFRASGGMTVGRAERATTASGPQTVEGDFPLDYVYTVGIAGERVLRELRDHGRLLGTRCPTCQVTYAP